VCKTLSPSAITTGNAHLLIRRSQVRILPGALLLSQSRGGWQTAAFTGLRQGELVALRWRDVDFPGEHVRVTASYTNGTLTSPEERQGALRADGARRGQGTRAAVPARAPDT
jgi:integrase